MSNYRFYWKASIIRKSEEANTDIVVTVGRKPCFPRTKRHVIVITSESQMRPQQRVTD